MLGLPTTLSKYDFRIVFPVMSDYLALLRKDKKEEIAAVSDTIGKTLNLIASDDEGLLTLKKKSDVTALLGCAHAWPHAAPAVIEELTSNIEFKENKEEEDNLDFLTHLESLCLSLRLHKTLRSDLIRIERCMRYPDVRSSEPATAEEPTE